jgi:hypothetical protein
LSRWKQRFTNTKNKGTKKIARKVADRGLRSRAWTGREGERHHAEHEGEAGHDDRAEPQLRCCHRRVDAAGPFAHALFGKFDDQDRVLGGEAHGRDQADLQVDVVVEAGELGAQDRANDTERNDEDHRERNGPAFVERGEAEEDDQQRQAVKRGCLAARLFLLIGQAGPLQSGSGRQLGLHLFHRLHRGAGADAGRGGTLKLQ